MPEYLEIHVKREPEPVWVELDDADPMEQTPGPVSGYYVDREGNRGERCRIERALIRKTRRVVDGETQAGRRVLVAV